jgi:hypothetical protein
MVRSVWTWLGGGELGCSTGGSGLAAGSGAEQPKSEKIMQKKKRIICHLW